jgi:hypothetical protein
MKSHKASRVPEENLVKHTSGGEMPDSGATSNVSRADTATAFKAGGKATAKHGLELKSRSTPKRSSK